MSTQDSDSRIIPLSQIATDFESEDPTLMREFVNCMKYISLAESGPSGAVSMKDIAQSMGVSRTTLFNWRNKWSESGLLQKCRMRYFMPTHAEEVRIKHSEVFQRWGEVLDRQLQTAIKGKSDQFALQAAQWLEQTIIKPQLEMIETSSADELEYVKKILTQGGVPNVFDV